LVFFSPITVLLLKLQYQLTLKKWTNIQEIENQNVLAEFESLSYLLNKLEKQHWKAMNMDLSFEIFHQTAITIVLLLFSISQTKTTSAMEAIFVPQGNEIFGIIINGYFIFNTSLAIGLISFMIRSGQGSYRSLKSRLAFGLYGILNLILRLLAIVNFFIPSLGMLNVLRHLQTDRIPFANPQINGIYRYNFSNDTLYFGNAAPIAWTDITNVNYSKPDKPSLPQYTLYTGINSKHAFIIFSFIWILQIAVIWIKNSCKSRRFNGLGFLDQLVHSFKSVTLPAPSTDWETTQGDSEEHFVEMKNVETEVVSTIKINFLFQILHLTPMLYLAYTVTKRQWILEDSIGTMDIENEAFATIWITIIVSLSIFLIGPILSCLLFKWANSKLNPCFGIITEEVKKEEEMKKKSNCFGICSMFSLFRKFKNGDAIWF